MTRRRRRAAGRRWDMVEDAFDLFLDAMANTLGVIMFIALMVVLFAAPPKPPAPATPRVPSSEAAQVAELLERLAALESELEQLPPQGDPELVARMVALEAELQEVRDALARTLQATAEAADALRDTRRLTRETDARTRGLEARRQEVERRTAALGQSSSFVRLSRFRQDERRPVLLLVSAQGVERAEPVPGETTIRPGGRHIFAIETNEQALMALPELLRGTAPSTHRLEVGVWDDAFAAYKRLERTLVEAGYDLNPLPVPTGKALEAGASGIQ
ncbi:MAG: hypothetical protein KF724_12695 [Phycisphaeraceae bacterium]|nr:hypothetical protein [Phycisphaeraceae bacterium]